MFCCVEIIFYEVFSQIKHYCCLLTIKYDHKSSLLAGADIFFFCRTHVWCPIMVPYYTQFEIFKFIADSSGAALQLHAYYCTIHMFGRAKK